MRNAVAFCVAFLPLLALPSCASPSGWARTPETTPPSLGRVQEAARAYVAAFDEGRGEFDPALKPFLPEVQSLLFRQYARSRDRAFLEPALKSLQSAATVECSERGEGSARFAAVFLEAYQLSRKAEFARAARKELGCAAQALRREEEAGPALSALALGAQVLDDPGFLASALEAGRRALGSRKKALAAGRGAREPFARKAFLCRAFLDLYEASFDPDWLDAAAGLGEDLQKEMRAAGRDAFSEAAARGEAPGAVAALSLLRLSQFTGRKELQEAAERALRGQDAAMRKEPRGMAGLRAALDFARSKPRQIILAGAREDAMTQEMLSLVRSRFLAHRILLLVPDAAARERLAIYMPFVHGARPIGGKTTAYVCQNYACEMPTTELQVLSSLLDASEAPR